jgi:hypothetical protein
VVDREEMAMGYGEAGGGGSVCWTIVHGGDGTVKNDKDKKPEKGGKFILIVNGERSEFDIKNEDDQIQIYWPPHHPDRMDEETKEKIRKARKENHDKVFESV